MKEDKYNNLIKPIIEIYDKIELELLENIARRFDTYDSVGGSLDWYLKKLEDMGSLNKSNIKIIADKSKLTEEEIKKLMKDVGYNITHGEEITKAYEKGVINKDSNNLYKSIAINNVINNAVNYSKDMLKLINTKALESSNKAYIDILNDAYIKTSSGIYSYNETIKNALIKMADNGIKGATYSRGGKEVTYSLEGTVRRDILTKTRQTANEVSLAIDDEIGNDLVYVTQHYGARPTHALWQGKVYSKSGTSDKYPDLVKSTGYGTITGLGGVNCRHFIQSFIEGITKIPTELDVKENERIYNLTQEQRSYERNVRNNKKELAVAKTLDDNELVKIYKRKLNISQSSLTSFIDKHKELKMDYLRLQVPSENVIRKSIIINNNEVKNSTIKIDDNKKNILTNENKYAINTYVGSKSYIINEKLRNDVELNSYETKVIKDLDNALEKMANYQGDVKRSVCIYLEDIDKFLKDYKVDDKVIMKSYISTTSGSTYNPEANIQMFIKSKTGKDIRKFNNQEQEILFRRETTFKVLKINNIDNFYKNIYLEEL